MLVELFEKVSFIIDQWLKNALIGEVNFSQTVPDLNVLAGKYFVGTELIRIRLNVLFHFEF